jgi:hypothetical protein
MCGNFYRRAVDSFLQREVVVVIVVVVVWEGCDAAKAQPGLHHGDRAATRPYYVPTEHFNWYTFYSTPLTFSESNNFPVFNAEFNFK